MTSVLIVWLIALAAGVVATRAAIAVSWRTGALDRPDGVRKLHRSPTPRFGGPAVFVAFWVPLIALIVFFKRSNVALDLIERSHRIVGLYVGASMALLLGVVDDRLNLRPRWKLLFQTIIAVVAFYFGFSIDAIGNPVGKEPLVLGFFALPVTVFWFLGCMNAVNLLDGLDGLAAGAAMFVSITLFMVCMHFGNVKGMLLMASLAGATLGFLVFNFPPARIFLGDSGSMLLGFMIGALSLIGSSSKAHAAVALFVPVVALGLPIMDTAVAIVRRWYQRLPISTPDRQHIHHLLVSMGYGPRRAVLSLYLICLCLGIAALIVTMARSEVVLLVMGSLIVTAFVCVRVFAGVRIRDVMGKLAEDVSRRDRLSNARASVEHAVVAMGNAESMENVWLAACTGFEALGLLDARLEFKSNAASRQSLLWRNPTGETGQCDTWSAALDIGDDGAVVARLCLKAKWQTDDIVPGESDFIARLRSQLASDMTRLNISL